MNGLSSSRVLVLDGIRGLAICLVLLHHFYEMPAAPLLVDRIAFGLAESGWVGVDLFFVLSGFLITGILYDSKGVPGYFANFYARRTLRIFPLYYATLFLFFIALPLVPHPATAEYVRDSAPDQAWFWTYLTNFRVASRGAWYDYLVPTVFWSLAIEEQFYLLWPILVLSFSRRTLMRICMALIGVALGVRVLLAVNQVSSITTFVLTPARMDCLLVGGLIALILRDDTAFQRLARGASWAAPVLGVGLVLMSLPHGTLEWRDSLTQTVGFSAVALLCGSMLVLTVNAAPDASIRRLFESRSLRELGKYSYAMYIFHGPSGTLVKQIYDFDQAPLVLGSALPFTVLYSVLATLVTFAAAWASWHLFERHFLRWQSRFRRDSQRSVSPEQARILHDAAVPVSR